MFPHWKRDYQGNYMNRAEFEGLILGMTVPEFERFIDLLVESQLWQIPPYPASPVADPSVERDKPQ